jgi:hypothetical protein
MQASDASGNNNRLNSEEKSERGKDKDNHRLPLCAAGIAALLKS